MTINPISQIEIGKPQEVKQNLIENSKTKIELKDDQNKLGTKIPSWLNLKDRNIAPKNLTNSFYDDFNFSTPTRIQPNQIFDYTRHVTISHMQEIKSTLLN